MINLKKLYPPAKIGIIGGGQLGRMLSFEAKRMGYHVTVLDPTPHSPAGQVSDSQITAAFDDADAIRRLADCTDVLTYEFEHINADILCSLKLEGYRVYPSGTTLKKIQDKYAQKHMLRLSGQPVPDFVRVSSVADINHAAGDLGVPLILKTCYGGYDGKGNYVIKHIDDFDNAFQALGSGTVPLMAERFIDFSQEVSIMVARGGDGEIILYPIVHNFHEDSILRISRVPAGISVKMWERIEEVAISVMETLDDVGVFCIEMFIAKDGSIYINEIAPRPHNSGHYSIEAAYTSQYEQLLRAITGMPLGSTKLLAPAVMVNILGNDTVKGSYGIEGYENILNIEGVYPHLYGKASTNTLKKIGHITVLGSSVQEAEEKASKLLRELKIVPL